MNEDFLAGFEISPKLLCKKRGLFKAGVGLIELLFRPSNEEV
jgi:hypothetical protein